MQGCFMQFLRLSFIKKLQPFPHFSADFSILNSHAWVYFAVVARCCSEHYRTRSSSVIWHPGLDEACLRQCRLWRRIRAQDVSLGDSSVSSCSCMFHPGWLGLSYLSGTGRSTGTYILLRHFPGVLGGAHLSRPWRAPSPWLPTPSEYAVYPESRPWSFGQCRSPGLE